MKTNLENIYINQISFETGDQYVYANVTLQKNSLSYPSQLILNFTDLNIMINRLQQKNPDTIISSLFLEEKMYDGSLLYTLSADKNPDTDFYLNRIEFTEQIKQIRA